MSAGEIAGIAAAGITLVGVAFAAIEWWRHRRELKMASRGWLHIPQPPPDQSPLKPVFWVYPPIKRDDGSYDLVVAGKVVNAGPADAYSVRIFAGPEFKPTNEDEWDRWRDVVNETVETAIAPEYPDRDVVDLYLEFIADHKFKSYYRPLLKRDEEERFVVVAHYEKPTSYLESIAKDRDESSKRSRGWVHDHLQAHPVNAAERTALGHAHRFGPKDLCAPFEKQRALRQWERATG